MADTFPPQVLLEWTQKDWRGATDFRTLADVRTSPNIRRGLWYPYTVISQYEHSTALRMLLQGEEYVFNPHWEAADFYAKVFNPHTCLAWGLDIWGVIVGFDRTLKLKGLDDWFGFLGSDLLPMDQAPFYDPEGVTAHTLDDKTFRKYIFYKAAINICDGSLAVINILTQKLFEGRGSVKVLHAGTMHMRFWFDFQLSRAEKALFLRDDIPPVPAGVGYDVMTVDSTAVFGFYGSELQPMDQGTFVPDGDLPTNAYSI